MRGKRYLQNLDTAICHGIALVFFHFRRLAVAANLRARNVMTGMYGCDGLSKLQINAVVAAQSKSELMKTMKPRKLQT